MWPSLRAPGKSFTPPSCRMELQRQLSTGTVTGSRKLRASCHRIPGPPEFLTEGSQARVSTPLFETRSTRRSMPWRLAVSEADGRAKRYAQVVACSIVEVDFVARVQTEPEGSPECFRAAAGIEDGVYVIGAQIRYGAEKCSSGHRRGAQSKIYK